MGISLLFYTKTWTKKYRLYNHQVLIFIIAYNMNSCQYNKKKNRFLYTIKYKNLVYNI